MKNLVLLGLFLIAGSAANAAITSKVTALSNSEESLALVQSVWGYESGRITMTLVLTPGSISRGEFQGYSVRFERDPVSAASLQKDYWHQPVRNDTSGARAMRVSLGRDEVPNGYVAMKFWRANESDGEIEVYCVPLAVLEQAFRAHAPNVEPTTGYATLTREYSWLEAFAPVIDLPKL